MSLYFPIPSPTYAIDPVNGSDAPSNPGTSSATALRSWQELARRWWGGEVTQNTTITLLGDSQPYDVASWLFTVRPGALIMLVGSLGPTTGFGGAPVDNTLYAGSVTDFHAASVGPAADEIQLVDASLPSSFTDSGLLASGVIFERTSGSPLYWYMAKDEGAKTGRISAPMNQAQVPMSSALTIGDAYKAFKLWQLPEQNWGNAAPYIKLDSVKQLVRQQIKTLGWDVRRIRTWIAAQPGVNFPNIVVGYSNVNVACDVPSGQLLQLLPSEIPTQFAGGMWRGSGVSLLDVFGSVGFGGTIFQGFGLRPNDATTLNFQATCAFFDLSVDAVAAISTAVVNMLMSGPGGLSGKGNTGKLISLSGGAAFRTGLNTSIPPLVDGVTSDLNPLRVSGTDYPLSVLPTLQEIELKATEWQLDV